jgi:hypothetical protein
MDVELDLSKSIKLNKLKLNLIKKLLAIFY